MDLVFTTYVLYYIIIYAFVFIKFYGDLHTVRFNLYYLYPKLCLCEKRVQNFMWNTYNLCFYDEHFKVFRDVHTYALIYIFSTHTHDHNKVYGELIFYLYVLYTCNLCFYDEYFKVYGDLHTYVLIFIFSTHTHYTFVNITSVISTLCTHKIYAFMINISKFMGNYFLYVQVFHVLLVYILLFSNVFFNLILFCFLSIWWKTVLRFLFFRR